MRKIISLFLFLSSGFLSPGILYAKEFKTIANVYGRDYTSLNGEWNIIIDPFDGGRNHFWKNIKPSAKNEFREYSFDGERKLNVPGDFNSQMPELKYYEGTVWYGKYFDAPVKKTGDKMVLYFAGVTNIADVYLNGEKIGSHEGGFTPFSFDVTDKLKDENNFIAVAVNNRRNSDGVPGPMYDWWNYGGITRDVMLVNLPETYIEDYFVRLDPEDGESILVDVELSSDKENEEIIISIPELGIENKLLTDKQGKAALRVKPDSINKWSPKNPKLYDVTFKSGPDSIKERIGFRTVRTDGTEILLNGEPIFLCGINIHEEIPQRKGRAFSEADAAMILHEVKELGANFIRLSHYPQNEYILRMAEEMGFLMWEEIPIWQNVDFANQHTFDLAGNILEKMIDRDKNRAAIIFWSVANETWPSEARNPFLISLADKARQLDDTRLVTAAFNSPSYNPDTKIFDKMNDPLVDKLDVVGVNKYLGWYEDWHESPSETVWNIAPDKPLIFSEFGGEALYGQHNDTDAKMGWSEELQDKIYEDNIIMFGNIDNLVGVSPWVLFDFMSPVRFSPQQNYEFNRKGIISDKGQRKKSWYRLRDYYKEKLDGKP